MRCTRCDRIAISQSVGRTPDVELVFGWYQRRAAEADCRLEELAARRFWRRISQPLEQLARAKVKPRRGEIENCRLGLMGMRGC